MAITITKDELIEMKLVPRAAKFCVFKHQGQKRKNGEIYATHPRIVADIVRFADFDENYEAVAFLHDTLEDTDTTKEELIELFGSEIANSVELLTREDGMDESVYIDRILTDDMATVVKIADKIHNLLDITTLDGVGNERTEKNTARARKYIDKAKKYYSGRFCPYLDSSIKIAGNLLNNMLVEDITPYLCDAKRQSFVTYAELAKEENSQ